jgi:ankyrin repeat protein
MEVVVSTSLPAAANLEQLRKQAKDLARSSSLRLSDAQLAVARRYGFPSWPKLRAYVVRVEANGPELQHAFDEDQNYYADRADGLLASAQDGTPSSVAEFTRRSAPLTKAGARAVVAANHGFESWTALRRHVAGLRSSGEPFARAFQLVRARDLAGLGALLDRFPELVTARGTNGNDLLALASATCDERLVALLLTRGADVARGNAHGWTALHQAGYSNLPHMARVLLDAGAPVDVSARGDGGTPLAVALFWGNVEVAGMLAARGVAPRNLRTAAGLDDVTALAAVWGAPGVGRGFYRPHSGFPAWRPSDDPAQVRDEALSWAARSDAVGAIAWLHEHGAAVDANVYRGTALTWAAARGRARAVRLLLALGAGVDVRGTFGGPQHGVGTTALHHAAEGGHLEVIEVLLAAGADRTIEDDLYGGTPASWAAHNGQSAAHALLSG